MEAASIRRLVAVTALLASVALAPALHAQGAGRSLDIDTSIRSAAMGGAGEAVPWGGDGDAWANPALLGYHRGLLHQWNRTQLVPGLATDVFLVSERQSVYACGVGLTQGDVHLDYGLSVLTDNEGNPIGTSRSFESSTYEGIGVSVSTLADALTGHAADGGGPLARLPLSPDVAFGYTHKRIAVNLGPGVEDGTDAVDWGMLVKVTPLRMEDVLGAPLAVDLALGHSVLNASDSRLLPGLANPDGYPTSRIERDGLAAHAAAGLPKDWKAGMTSGWKRWLAASLEPLVDLSYALDSEHISAGGEGDSYDVSRWGGELALANLFWLRTGHISDKESDIIGSTSGWGLGLSLGGVVGYRYDHATVPQARNSDLPDVERRGWIAWIDPVAMVRMMK
jgi:hypothetical protein